CDSGSTPAAVIRTSLSLAVVCETSDGEYYYRGERLRDGANIELQGATRSGDGFVAVNPDDGARYDVQPDQLTISSNGSVDSAEPALEYGTG
ncbi:MAG: serine/threonine protein kinase, partial [Mycobacterium sp.]|nr:serine/threonine protein kinase [Mycobacterium sp.]